jgi:hypothetical protein
VISRSHKSSETEPTPEEYRTIAVLQTRLLFAITVTNQVPFRAQIVPQSTRGKLRFGEERNTKEARARARGLMSNSHSWEATDCHEERRHSHFPIFWFLFRLRCGEAICKQGQGQWTLDILERLREDSV